MSTLFPSHAKIRVDADGIHVETDDAAVPDARSRFMQRLADAWKHDAGKGPYGVIPRAPDPETVYAGFKQQLSTAWQNASRGGPLPRAPKPTDPPWQTMAGGRRRYRPGRPEYDNDSADSADFHFDDDDADAQAVRDAANAKYCDRIRNAWKEPK
jgi:hypothetical protein